MEGEIANSRKYYNAVVKQFNTRIQVFPGNVLAGMFGFFKQAMFEVGAEEERQNVAVRF
jgi:LemA protein